MPPPAIRKITDTLWELPVRDRELACAPFSSEEGRRYFSAMNCAVNMASVNLQVYDATHNTAKFERLRVVRLEPLGNIKG